MANRKTKIMNIDENHIDLASCYDPIFEPPKSFLDECRKRWKEVEARALENKPSVPTFYVRDIDGVEYFYHGNTRIRVSEHFADSGKSYEEIAAESIRYTTGHTEKPPLAPAC